MGVGVDAGGNTKQDPLTDISLPGQLVQRMQFIGIICNKGANAHVQGVHNIPVSLIVPVEVNALCRESGMAGGVQLPAGHTVHTQAFLRRNAVHFGKAKGFGGVQGKGIRPEVGQRRLPIGAAHGTHSLLIHDIKGGAEGFGKVNRVCASDGQVAFLVHSEMVVQQIHHARVPFFLSVSFSFNTFRTARRTARR